MTKKGIPFASTLALTFVLSTVSAQEPSSPSDPTWNPEADKWMATLYNCAQEKFTAIKKEADEIVAHDPAKGESLIRAYGQKASLPEEYIASDIAGYKSLDDAQKKIVVQKMLAAAMEPSPVFACMQEADAAEQQENMMNKKDFVPAP